MTGPPIPAAEPALRPGARVSHYEVTGLVGRGGMGIVYRAQDLHLGREVAIKCIRPDRAEDPDYRRRLIREARAASRLSHPNIVRVLDVLEVEGLPAIVMELVAGESLRDRLQHQGPVPVEELLGFAEDITRALEGAHGEGLLHRDITPNNVMLAPDGRALLMDFGLAKRLGSAKASTASVASTESTPGEVVGTPGYMAPEQILGRPVDRRTDIFSLGVVLYEMCTGVHAFPTSSSGDFIDATLHREPAAIGRLNYSVPEELERIIRKAMAKRPDERYQEARELMADLKALRRRGSAPSAMATTVTLPGKRRHYWMLASSAVAGAAAVALAGWLSLGRHRGLPPLPEASPRQLTNGPGLETEPAISPDGSFVAYASNETGNFEIYLVDVATGQVLRLTEDAAEDRSPAWFPDGTAIAFSSDRGGSKAIYKVARLGGSPVLVLPDAEDPAISPDGTRIAFARPKPGGGPLAIHVAELTNPATATPVATGGGALLYQRHPVWSPDGTTICYEDFDGLWVIPGSGGTPSRVTGQPTLRHTPAFSPATGFLYSSAGGQDLSSLWRTSPGRETPQQVTLGSGLSANPTISRDGLRLAYCSKVRDWELTLVELGTGVRTPLTSMRYAYCPNIRPNRSAILFIASPLGVENAFELQLVNERPAGQPRTISDVGDLGTMALSPDGRYLVYHRNIHDQRDLWIGSASGGPLRRLVDDPAADVDPAWSPDGSHLAFSSNRAGSFDLWVLPMKDGHASGPAERLSALPGSEILPVWSPDGTSIAYIGEETFASDAWVVGTRAGEKPRRLTSGAQAVRVAWSPWPGSLLVSGTWGGNEMEVRRVHLDTGATESLVPRLSLGDQGAFGDFSVDTQNGLLACPIDRSKGHVWVLLASSGRF